MDVEILPPATGTPMLLTGARPEEGVNAFELTPDRAQEVWLPVRGATVRTVDHGNQSHRLAFSVTREWPSAGEAALYALTHAQSVPPKGRVKFTCRDQDGAVVGTAWLEDAIIKATRTGWETCATTFAYEVVGGAMTTGS